MLQDLCPRCGAEWSGWEPTCVACGRDPTALGTQPEGDALRRGVTIAPRTLALGLLNLLALVAVAFGIGLQLGRPAAVQSDPERSAVADAPPLLRAPSLGRVLFAERLGEGLELEGYRTQFREEDTIAWRAEFLEPPPGDEVTLVIAWQSIRETMQLSRTTVAIPDPRLALVARDEVPVGDLVPTAGIYSVAYYAHDAKVAEGTFELLPPSR